MNVAISIAFDGANYHGWQRQKNAISVQEVLENNLSKIAGEDISVTGCGRTDAGVHALNFYLNVDLPEALVKDENIVYRLNRMLPKDIAVKGIFEVSPSFNARFDAMERTYRYHVHLKKNPFLEKTSWLLPSPFPDFAKFEESSQVLLGKQDFTSFSKVHTQTKTNICRVTKAHWKKVSEAEYFFEISADRFLRNMVRSIVGTFMDTIADSNPADKIRQIIDAKSRDAAGVSVPGKALFLHDIQYPNDSLIPLYGSKIT